MNSAIRLKNPRLGLERNLITASPVRKRRLSKINVFIDGFKASVFQEDGGEHLANTTSMSSHIKSVSDTRSSGGKMITWGREYCLRLSVLSQDPPGKKAIYPPLVNMITIPHSSVPCFHGVIIP